MHGVAGNEAGGSQIVAAIDAGTNSVHLLVVNAIAGQLRPVADERIFVGLGSAIERGVLGSVRHELISAIANLADMARALGARPVAILGTEPLRRVADAMEVADEVERRTGFALDVITHEEEGLLTLLGVTLGEPIEHDVLVADVGGGSSELVLAGPGRLPVAIGIRLGSARLIERHAEHDPPTKDEMAAMRRAADAALAGAPAATVDELVVVGGTATNLLRVIPPEGDDRTLDASRIESVIERLTEEPSAAVAVRHGVHPARARTLPAGAAILRALIDRYGVDRLTVSDASLREGAVIALARAGGSWRTALPALVRGPRAIGGAGPKGV